MLQPIDHDLPRCWPPLRWVGTFVLWLTGWTVFGGPRHVTKAVLVAAPHTSNWDFFYALMASWRFGMSIEWLGKDALFRGPMGWLLTFLGGIPVDRSASHGLVGEAVAKIRSSERIVLMVPPSGTRGYRPYWKSGFYWIALEAGVPILPGVLDFGKRRLGIADPIMPTGDVKADMDALRAAFGDADGLFPDQKSGMRLRAEDEVPAETETAEEAPTSGS